MGLFGRYRLGLLATLVFTCVPLAAAPAQYRVIDLGPAVEGYNDAAQDINEEGRVAFQYGGKAWLWHDVQNDPTEGLPNNSQIRISDSDYLAGSDTSLAYQNRAYLWKDGNYIWLGQLKTNDDTYCTGVNAANQVVGRSGSAGFFWDNGVMTEIAPGNSYWPSSINDAGIVPGSMGDKPYLWQEGTLTALEIPDGYTQGTARATNALGTTVGFVRGGAGVNEMACMWIDN